MPLFLFQALQAPACHENMVKVGGYILGEFGNLIAGDPRSRCVCFFRLLRHKIWQLKWWNTNSSVVSFSPLVQFNLLHSKFHLCSVPTRALLLSAYIKFINLFPETKATIQEVLRCDSQIRNSDVELQQRAVEYLKLSSIASTDVLVSSCSRHHWKVAVVVLCVIQVYGETQITMARNHTAGLNVVIRHYANVQSISTFTRNTAVHCYHFEFHCL